MGGYGEGDVCLLAVPTQTDRLWKAVKYRPPCPEQGGGAIMSQ